MFFNTPADPPHENIMFNLAIHVYVLKPSNFSEIASTDVSLAFACFVILFQGRARLDSLQSGSPLYPVEFSRVTCWVIRGDGLAQGTRALPGSISSVSDVGNR